MVNSVENDRIYERLQLIVNGPALFNAIVSALELDIFGYLAEHPGSSFADLRTFTGLPDHSVRVLLFALCATELVDKRDGGYVNSAVAAATLAHDRPESWRDTLIGWRRFQYPAFPHTTTALRAGENTALDDYPGAGTTLYERLSADPDLVAAYHDHIKPFTHLYLSALVEHPELSTVEHLLDVGGGDGTTARGFAARYPRSRVTIFDMPSVAAHAEHAEPEELGERIRLHAGNIFTDEFPRDVDGILFSHVLEPFDEERCVALLTKAFDVLPAGGKLFTYGTTASDDERTGLLAARLSLYLNVLVSAGGMAHPAADYERWLWKVGCDTVARYPGLPYEHALVVGTKK
jgi:ubiquinone/menaquinone biosynthesis C-methylase UbiE